MMLARGRSAGGGALAPVLAHPGMIREEASRKQMQERFFIDGLPMITGTGTGWTRQ
jgi:hypothetical protein